MGPCHGGRVSPSRRVLASCIAAGATAALLAAGVGCTQPTGATSEWSQFLGPGRDGKSDDPIVRDWGADGPPVLWYRDVGEGLAAPAVAGGKLLLFHRLDDAEIVEALDPLSGEPIWATGYPTTYRDDFGFDEGSRAAPAIVGGAVYTHGAQGVVQALDLETGELLWSLDTHEEFGVPKGPFGAGSTPLVADGQLILNVGGPAGAGIVALDAATGALVWKATDHGAGYSVPVLATINGDKRVLVFTKFGLVDLDPVDGSVRAERRWRSRSRTSVNAASPVVIGNRVFVSAAYGTGAVLFNVTARGLRKVWASDEVLSNHYATTIHHDGTLYGYHGRQPLVPALRAVDAVTGTVLWSEERFGAGSLLLSDGTLIVLRENGELLLADTDTERFVVRARAMILKPTVRAYPALAASILYARDEQSLIAIDLR